MSRHRRNEADMLKAVADVKRRLQCPRRLPRQLWPGNAGNAHRQIFLKARACLSQPPRGDGDLINGRGDAYCGMLNCSYNLGMRHLKGYIPEYPVGTAEDIAKMIADFIPIASRYRCEEPQDHHLRPASAGLLRLQRAHQGPVRAGCGDRGELRAGSACFLQRPTQAMRAFPPSARI